MKHSFKLNTVKSWTYLFKCKHCGLMTMVDKAKFRLHLKQRGLPNPRYGVSRECINLTHHV